MSAFSPISMSVPHRRSATGRTAFFNELAQCLFDFVIQLLPTAEEMAVKEDVRKLLEKLIRTIEPESRLLSFGSTANGFSLRNSDMDLCCLIDSKGPPLQASDLVTMLGDLLERETKFHVKTLPFARIPIVKLSLDPSPGLPFGISCDIGFENRLALENTRLLLSYASVDPTRVRTIVLFLKVWTKRRKINSPYRGTLSSYGYVLLVIYFLVHVKNPPVLPNLQQMPPLRPISHEDTHIGEHNIWFFDDTELLRRKWQSANTETVAELLIDFFKYYSRDFSYNTGVASIRSGLLKKESKGWATENDGGRYSDSSRDRNRLCIEDPFETNYNVSRTVTKDGLYTIRGEFMRASRILAARPERAIIALAQLCEEREDELIPATAHPYPLPAPRLAPLPPQVPYTVGSSPRPPTLGPGDRLSPPRRLFDHLLSPSKHSRNASEEVAEGRVPPQHMAPTRGKWTSPPPPDAPPAVLESYTSSLGLGLSLATSSSVAREAEARSASSLSSSDALTDEDLRSGTTDSQPSSPPGDTSLEDDFKRSGDPMRLHLGKRSTPDLSGIESPKLTPKASQLYHQRGRPADRSEAATSLSSTLPRYEDSQQQWPTLDSLRRSSSGPPSLRSPASVPRNALTSNGSSAKPNVLPLTVDTGYFPVLSSPSPSPNHVLHSSSPRSPWTQSSNHISNSNLHRHQHSSSTSSNHPASVTIYRSQPQATTFPLYQQSQSGVASTSSRATPSPSSAPAPHDFSHDVPSQNIPQDTSKTDTKPAPSYSAAVTAKSHTRGSPDSPGASVNISVPTVPTTLTPASHKGTSSPASGSSRNTSASRLSYDPSAAFRIPTSTVLPPSPPESNKSFLSNSPHGRTSAHDRSPTSSPGSSPPHAHGGSPASSPGAKTRASGGGSPNEPFDVEGSKLLLRMECAAPCSLINFGTGRRVFQDSTNVPHHWLA
ncbi:hypothetical protein BS47DRAFT_1483802 [Hydnum rufescens UP504]|uniref:polynucleotide adenylyltransferase n=1 Tax=Hydnum rufescens UP504 TaxID=1448309 RepID=A0A9P6B2R9_9AGAM|nr:hypothetical protein BS47DRAFT_1483802 [Hydnum rufescens UP504]